MSADGPGFFERQADARLLAMSDGSSIRILVHARTEDHGGTRRPALVFVGGWDTNLTAWDGLLMAASKTYDVVVFESREKCSSLLAKASINDVERVSLDLSETLRSLAVDEGSTVVLASSWGTILLAHALARRTCSPMLSVLLGPIGRLTFPPLLRSVLPRLPSFVLSTLRPFAYVWLLHANGGDLVQTRRTMMVLANADFKKWAAVGRFVVAREFWDLFADIEGRCLIIYSDRDRFHDLAETRRIIDLIPDATAVQVDHADDLTSAKVIELINLELEAMRSRGA